jgi:hypothetical protein
MPYSQPDRAQINRNNASHSTGPQTFEGRRRSALNALCHGLTGQTVVMPSEDLEAYQRHIQSFVNEYHPQGATETHLVQSLADAAWRINRVAILETNLLTHDIIYDDFPNHESTHEMRHAIAIAAALDKHTRTLSTLSMHGQRLSRQFERTLALLKSLQSARHQLQVKPPAKSVQTNRVQPNGFVFPKAAQRAIGTPTVREASTPTNPPRQPTKGGSADVN